MGLRQVCIDSVKERASASVTTLEWLHSLVPLTTPCPTRADHRPRFWPAVVLLAACAHCARPSPPVPLPPLTASGATEPVPADPDDPAIWVHPTDSARSLVLGTDKVAASGGLHVFGLDGVRRQVIGPLDRPNNVDVEYGMIGPGGVFDIAVVTERLRHRLRVFRIPADGGALLDLAPEGLPVLTDATGEAAEPMGIALYRRAGDGAVFAIVAPKLGGATNYLRQYRLEFEAGTLRAREVRRFGHFSQRGPEPGEPGEIEAVVVDDELGYVYYADERFGLRKWHADPDHAEAGRELAVFGLDHYLGDREGLALYRRPDGSGFLVSSDQVVGGTRLMLYPREGAHGMPHDHPLIAAVPTVADETDGLDVAGRPLPGFAGGLLVMMNSSARNFLLFPWDAVASRLRASRP